MDAITFTALGTIWNIRIDGKKIPENTKECLIGMVRRFERRFSRFLSENEASAFCGSPAGRYPMPSPEFLTLLSKAKRLRELTSGRFDPAVASLLDHAGYNASYRFSLDTALENISVPKWDIVSDELLIDGPISFDFGGIGKGYCIDLVSTFLKENEFFHHIVEAGGDIFATEKIDGSPYKAGIEAPWQEGIIIGTVLLQNQGLAVSDRLKRKWGKWHHIIDVKTKEPVMEIMGCVAIARSAFDADSATSLIFFLNSEEVTNQTIDELGTEYLIFDKQGRAKKSSKWNWPLF